MFIAVSSEGKDLYSQVSNRFETCNYLLIVNMDTMDVKAIENNGDKKGEALAHKVNEYNCEAILTGELTPEAFEILAGDCVTRYVGYGLSAENALMQMERHALKLIRNPEGTDTCESDHHEGSCDGHDHER